MSQIGGWEVLPDRVLIGGETGSGNVVSGVRGSALEGVSLGDGGSSGVWSGSRSLLISFWKAGSQTRNFLI